MKLTDRIAQIEQRQQARRMPRRPRSQFLALDQNNVGPAHPGEMIERTDANDAAANDYRSCRLPHAIRPVTLQTLYWLEGTGAI